MKAVLPRAVVYHGNVWASAMWIDPALIGEAEAKARVVALWCGGTRVFQVAGGYLVQLVTPMLLDVRSAPGQPLLGQTGFLSACPLTTKERAMLAIPAHAVVLPCAGVARVFALGEAVDVSSWLDLDGWHVATVTDLGAPLAAPIVALTPKVINLRESLLGKPASAEQIRMVKKLRGLTMNGLERFAALLARLRALVQTRTPSDANQSRTNSNWLKNFLAKLLANSRLMRAFDYWNARYLARLMQMFDDGDLYNALRHAIPLGELSNIKEPPPRFMGLFKPRPDLSITEKGSQPTSGIGVSTSLSTLIQQRYMAAYQRLVQRGQIQEAAFVLAELLNRDDEAVGLLEQHGFLRQAAELAEGCNLAAGLIIRQWFLAGESERAIAIARRSGAFSDAVIRLEKDGTEVVASLRTAWANSLVDQGNYAAAVDVVRNLEDSKKLISRWLDFAIEMGGQTAGRMLGIKTRMFPEEFVAIREELLEQLVLETSDLVAEGFAAELALNLPSSLELQTLGRACLRTALRGLGKGQLNRSVVDQLSRLSQDASLRVDVPFQSRKIVERKELTLDFAAGDTGTKSITDAILLPDRKLIVALGEAGALLLNQQGRTIAHFDQPMDVLVAADHGARVIGMARRGRIWRLCRIDVPKRRAEFWCDAEITAFASDFDGSLWFVARHDVVYAIDAAHQRFEALWSVSEVGTVQAIARTESKLQFATSEEVWSYKLPGLILRHRQTNSPPDLRAVRIFPQNDTLVTSDDAGVWCSQGSSPTSPTREINRAVDWSLSNVFEAWAAISDRSIDVEARSISGDKLLAWISLGGAAKVRIRVQHGLLIVSDDQGRLLLIDAENSLLVHQFRL